MAAALRADFACGVYFVGKIWVKVKIIFGLGNPGFQYKNNRHNVGYMVVEELRKKEKIRLRRSFKFSAFLGLGKIGKSDVALAEPRTFMNNSAVCVKKILDNYKISPKDFLVVYDDVDLPLGIMRFRKRGRATHRGIASIIESLGSLEVNRLRIGIDKPGTGDLSNYVLSDFSFQEKEILKNVISKAASACIDWVNFGADFVMRNYNRKDKG